MDKTQFTDLLQHPYRLTKRECAALREKKAAYPFSSLLQLMGLLGEKACGGDGYIDASLYQLDKQFVEGLLQQVQEAEDDVQALGSGIGSSDMDVDVDIFKEINAYQEVSFKTAPKSVILSKFLDPAICESEEPAQNEHPTIEELGKKSVRVDDSLCTETLAIVLEQQCKWDKAIGVYEKLMSKYPEKSSIFANRISEIKSKVEY